MTDRLDVTETSLAASGSRFSGSLEPTADAFADAAGPASARPVRLSRGAFSWALYQGGRDPYIILLTIYIFAPYFATTVVGDPVKGQALLANINTLNGLVVALTAPLLGASIDQFGHRKPMLGIITLLMIPLIALLWFSKPGGAGLPVLVVAIVIGLLNVLFSWAEVLHNSLLTRAATPLEAPFASGLALSAGNFMSVFSLIFVLWAFVLPGHVDWGFVPTMPLFGLNVAEHEPDRVVTLIAAALLAVLCIPMFLFTPDARSTGMGLMEGLREGLRALKDTLLSLKGERDVALYLGSRMLFTDGMTALLIFAGVYAAGVMKWGTLELLFMGILMSVFAVLGGFVGAWLDSALGPRRAMQIEIAASLGFLVCQLGMARDKLLFFWTFNPAAQAPLWNGPMFRTWPELIYLIAGFGVAIFVTAHYASGRTLLTRLTPPGKSASFFGLYALSGTATVWLGSLLVNWATTTFRTQQAGFVPIAVLLGLGLTGLMFVRGGNKIR